jgi:DNA repair protein RecO (recombination protein O)
MPGISCDALVLRAHRLGETSKIVVFLTRHHGKARAVARGARGSRSRFQSSLEPLSEVRISLLGRQGADLHTLGQCELVRSAFPQGPRCLESALFLSYTAELLDAFVAEGDPDERPFRLAQAVVRAVSQGKDERILGRYLEAWLLKLSGLYPPLDTCSSCGGVLCGEERRYHRAAHGFVCENCGPASGPVLPAGARAFLCESFCRGPESVTAPGSAEGKSLESFHRNLMTSHLDRTLHSFRVLEGLARGVQP